MRELTKSVMSYAWAMSLFGVQQMVNVFRPSKAVESFESVTSAAEGELGWSLRSFFKAGDDVQRRMIDLMLGGGMTRARGDGRADETSARVPGTSPGQVGQTAGASAARAQADARPSGPGWSAIQVPGDARRRPTNVPQGRTDNGHARGKETPDDSDISPDYPFESRYAEVFGSRIHYIEAGEGGPVLFVHGNATWSYVWRNVIPYLSPHARCVALDLIGFGRSDKPDIEYRWIEQAEYLEEFIRKLGLRNVTLVLNDFGISLGMRYAMRHEENVRGMAFFEGVFKTFESLEEAYTPEFRPLFKQFRTGDEGGEGWKLLVEQNVFIEQLLPRAAGREFTERELSYYREPFREVRSRVPIWRFARSVPIGGEPEDVWEVMTEATEWLKQTELPKLLFYATPGGLVTEEFVEWCRRNLKNLKLVHVGRGVHYLQESSPHVLGRELVEWYGELGRAGRT